ncbi:MAG: aminotransferase class V-fold PLP-dependent enzyme, partial [Thermoflexibacteraceae bacterium]
MISFYPGPSQLAPNIRQYLLDIYDSQLLSRNHRSSEFIHVIAQTTNLLREKLAIPTDYSIFFVSSATEAWEIIAQSLVKQQNSLHFFNGAFGEKWYKTTQQLTHT